MNYAKAGSEALIQWSDTHKVFEVKLVREGKARAEDHRVVLLTMLAGVIAKGAVVSPSKRAETSTYNLLKDLKAFPQGLTPKTVGIEVSRWLDEGLVALEEFTRDNRTRAQKLVLTDAGRALIEGADAEDFS